MGRLVSLYRVSCIQQELPHSRRACSAPCLGFQLCLVGDLSKDTPLESPAWGARLFGSQFYTRDEPICFVLRFAVAILFGVELFHPVMNRFEPFFWRLPMLG